MISDQDFEIIFEDDQILVVNKKPGVAVHSEDESADLSKYFEKKYNQIHIITRLDQPVSGLVLFAKNAGAAFTLSTALQNNKLDKRYLAIVEGIVAEDEGILKNLLEKREKKQ